MVAVKSGFSIKEILSGLCERHGINGAAVDLFLVGGDKVLWQAGVSHQCPGPFYSLLLGLVRVPLLIPPLPPPAYEAVQLDVEAPGGQWVHGSTTWCLEHVRLILKLLFCSCSCVLLYILHAPTLTLLSLFFSLWCCIRTAASWPPGTCAWKSVLCFGKRTAYRFLETSRASIL